MRMSRSINSELQDTQPILNPGPKKKTLLKVSIRTPRPPTLGLRQLRTPSSGCKHFRFRAGAGPVKDFLLWPMIPRST